MNDPKRLREPGSQAPEGLRKLLERAAPTRPMTDAEKARIRLRLKHLMVTDEPTPESSHVRTSNGKVRYLAYGFAAMLAGTTVTVMTGNHCASRCEPLAEPIVPFNDAKSDRAREADTHSWKNAPKSESNHSATNNETSHSRSVVDDDRNPNEDLHRENKHFGADRPIGSPSPNAPRSVGAAEPSIGTRILTPRDAIVVLVEASRYLDEKNPTAALAQVNAYFRSFPTATLNTDAELIATDALIALGRLDEARARATALLDTTQGTSDEMRVQEKLSSIGKQNQRLVENHDKYDIILSPLKTVANVQTQDRTTLVWLRGIGTWQFETNIRMPTGIGKTYRAIVFGDFDADGHVDVAAVSRDTQVAWRGLEGGQFGAPIIAGEDMQAEIDDQEENDPRGSARPGDDMEVKSDDPFRTRMVADDKEERAHDWFYRWDVMGVEFMLDMTVR